MKTLNLYIFFLFTLLHTNAQNSWHTTHEFPDGPKTGIAINDFNTLFVGVTSGVIRSNDDGNKFEKVLNARVVFTVFAAKSGTVLAGGAGKIYRSPDSGMTWDSISLNNIYPVTQFIQDPSGNVYAITGTLDIELGYVGAGVFFSNDDGQSWSARNNGLGIYNSCQKIAADKNGRLYLGMADEYVTGNSGLFISDNQGLQWEHINVRIDGRGVVNDLLKIGNVTGLSVSPTDSLLFSFTGTAVNALVTLNLVKNINDIQSNNYWRVMNVFGSVSWWLDRNLGNIYFADDGNWFSSFSNSFNTGGTYFSSDDGKSWTRIVAGLGIDIFGRRNTQYFAENNIGKLFMIQYLSELVHIWGEDSSLHTNPGPAEKQWVVYPNPAKPGEKIIIHNTGNIPFSSISIYDITGRKINTWNMLNDVKIEINAPLEIGVYFIGIKQAEKLKLEKILIQK